MFFTWQIFRRLCLVDNKKYNYLLGLPTPVIPLGDFIPFPNPEWIGAAVILVCFYIKINNNKFVICHYNNKSHAIVKHTSFLSLLCF